MRTIRPLRLLALTLASLVMTVLLAGPATAATPAAAVAPVAAAATPVGEQYTPSGIRFTISLNVTIVVRGGTIQVFIRGAFAGEVLRGQVFSNPIDIGSVTADAEGNATTTFPTGELSEGPHTVVFTSTRDGYAQQVEFTVTEANQAGVLPGGSGASASGSNGGLAFTGSNAIVPLIAIGVVLVLGGVGGVLLGRKRRGELA